MSCLFLSNATVSIPVVFSACMSLPVSSSLSLSLTHTHTHTNTPLYLFFPLVSCPNNPANCFVVDAQIRLFGTDLPAQVSSSRNTIRTNMNNGQYDNTDNRIIDLVFLDIDGADQLTEDNGGGDRAPPPSQPITAPRGRGMPLYGWVLIMVGSVLLAAILCACPSPCALGNRDDDEDYEDEYISDHQDMLLDEEYDDFELTREDTQRRQSYQPRHEFEYV